MTQNVFAGYDVISDTAANRPATPTVANGRLCVFVATDTGDISLWTGVAWTVLSAKAVAAAAVLTANALTLGDGSRGLSSLTNGAAGTVLSGGTPPAFTATPSVTSITFGAGNALSAYVIGSWTPTVTIGGSSVGITYSRQNGRYVQLGKLVFLTCIIDLSSKGSSTGSVNIASLPFTSENSGIQRTTMFVSYDNTPSGSQMTENSTTSSILGITNANITNTSELIMSGSYIVA